ncbi:MAG: TonB-dependent receptor [Gammaproteobacteria bacterium]|nr:TonB-dependent receptor [Gammaproteobacteria bacterium]
MNNKQLSVMALLLGGSTLIQAADEALSPIVVTATRTAQSADETLASVTVITRAEIESSQATSLMELVQSRTVGLDLSRNGGPGSNTSLMLRGTNSNHLLVLIDGVRVNSAIDGGFKWNNLPLAQIERIEIVRGPRSTLYGADAIGGVVQIFTRKETGLYATLGGGSYNTLRTELGSGGTLGAGRYHLNAGYLESSGFSAAKPGTWGYEPDDDGYANSNLGAGIDYPLGSKGQASLNLLHSDADVETDDGSSSQRNDSGSLALNWRLGDPWQQTLILGHAADHYESDDGYRVHSLRHSASWQHDIQTSDNSLLSAGIDHVTESGESEGSYDEQTRTNALFAQYQWGVKRLDLLLGARTDDHSGFGHQETGNITLGGRLGGGRLYASYGSAFKAPTFLQRYYPTYGNPALKPEESVTSELGYRFGALQASLFDTHIENLINFTYPSGYSNVSRAHIQGIELEYGLKVESWQLNSGFTLQKTEDEQSGDPLLRRADKKLFFTASGPVSTHGSIGIEASYTGPRMDYGDTELHAFTLLNLTGEYRFTTQWSLRGRIENLLDEEYELASGYNTPGASAYLTLNYRQ